MSVSDSNSRPGGAVARGRRPSDATTISDILESAKEAFAKNGFDGATVDLICRRAKVSKQLLYYYFGSKAELYSVILEEAAEDTSELMAGADYTALDPGAALSEFVRNMFRDYVDRPQIVKMTIDEAQHNFVHVGTKSPLCAVLRKLIDEILTDILERGKASGDFRDDVDADQLFWVIFSMVTTWFAHFPLISRVTRAKDGSDIDMNRWASDSIDFVLAAIARNVQAGAS